MTKTSEYNHREAVDHPAHYGGKDDPYEAIKIIEAKNLDFCSGNALKYLLRAGKKSDSPIQDLEKAVWYLKRRIGQLEDSSDRKTAETIIAGMRSEGSTSEAPKAKRKKKYVFHMLPSGDITKMMVVTRADGTKYLLGKYPVTAGEYTRYCHAMGLKDPAAKAPYDHPITNVSAFDAEAYCKWAGLRLPTEEEWEFAATSGDGRTYPWGNELPTEETCWSSLDKPRNGPDGVFNRPKGASPFGCLDMSGNIWEWTSSPWNKNSSYRVLRGGGWSGNEPLCVRAAVRSVSVPSVRDILIGFRCARDYKGKGS